MNPFAVGSPASLAETAVFAVESGRLTTSEATMPKTNRRDFLKKSSVAAAGALWPVLPWSSFSASAAEADSVDKGTRLVARQDFDVSNSLTPPELFKRSFWNMMTHYAKMPEAYRFHERQYLPASAPKPAEGWEAIVDEPMVREAAVRYEQDYFPDLRANGDDPLAVNADRLRAIHPDPNVPFVVGSHAGRPPFRCLGDFHVDKQSYETWKAEHPNFLGFWTGVEWENEFIGCVLAHFPGVMEATKQVSSTAAIERMQAMEPWVTANRDAAVRGLHECYEGLRRYYFDDPDKMLFLRAAWCFDHFALEWGAGMAIYETSITGPYRHQVGMFHVRGAARQ
jgi:hypothetical protein